MTLPDLTPHEHEIAARECDAIADYFDKLADIHDGSLAPFLAMQHHVDAAMVRARGEQHRQIAEQEARR